MTRMATEPARKATKHLDIPESAFIVMEDISWAFYEQTLEELERSGHHLRITYDQGSMEIMTLGIRHEHGKKLIARLVEMYAIERDIPMSGLGSVTLKLKQRQRGLEPDECYYIQTPAPPSHVIRFDLEKFPPPDLGIEIDITGGSLERQPIYASLGVPEIWRFDGEKIIALHRRKDGVYRTIAKSVAFPRLAIADVNRFLALTGTHSQHAIVRSFRDWLRENA